MRRAETVMTSRRRRADRLRLVAGHPKNYSDFWNLRAVTTVYRGWECHHMIGEQEAEGQHCLQQLGLEPETSWLAGTTGDGGDRSTIPRLVGAV